MDALILNIRPGNGFIRADDQNGTKGMLNPVNLVSGRPLFSLGTENLLEALLRILLGTYVILMKITRDLFMSHRPHENCNCMRCRFADFAHARNITRFDMTAKPFNVTNGNLKREVFEAYGSACACCGESNPCFLTVDHIYNDGNEHRKEIVTLYAWLKRHGFPKDRFQLLCYNCNQGKAHYGGVCPHKQGVS